MLAAINGNGKRRAVDEYGIHPSPELRAIFESQEIPFQGQSLERAKVVFVGLDANYASNLLDYPDFFERVLEYHRDGVGFWKKHGVHHPFLLPEYPLPKNRGGVPYHRRFSQMGLAPDYADCIAFVELLNVPTTGRSEKAVFWSLLDPGYVRSLMDKLTDGRRRLVILSGSVLRTLSGAARRNKRPYSDLRLPRIGSTQQIGSTQFVRWRHLSSAISHRELASMGEEIRAFCDLVPDATDRGF